MIARSLLSLALLGFALATATAADLAVAPSPLVPAAATPFTWSGVYFGAQAGYG
jgi:hypothetical protein